MLAVSVHLQMRPIVKSVSQSLHLSLPLLYPLIMKIMIIFLFLTQTLLALSEGNSGEEDAPREYWLAIAYANGIEVAENKSVAASYFLEAAEIGHGPSQRNLGIMLGLGDGIPKNKVEAYAWLQIASVNKDEVAKEAFKDLKDNLSQEEIDAGKNRALQILERLSKIRENHKRHHLSHPSR